MVLLLTLQAVPTVIVGMGDLNCPAQEWESLEINSWCMGYAGLEPILRPETVTLTNDFFCWKNSAKTIIILTHHILYLLADMKGNYIL